MQGQNAPFRPAGTVTIAASTTSATAQLAGGGSSVLIYNESSATAFVRLGAASGLTALAGSDYPVPAGARTVIDGGPFILYAAVVLRSGTGNVYVSLGDGAAY